MTTIARNREPDLAAIARDLVDEALAECSGDAAAVHMLGAIMGAVLALLELRTGREETASLLARQVLALMGESVTEN